MGRLTALLLALLLLPAGAARADKASFEGWAVAVIAGDWQAHGGTPTAAFENARRDLSAALLKAGVDPANLRQFSPTAHLRGETGALRSERRSFGSAWFPLASRAKGCLVYVTSHGSPEGFVMGDDLMSPQELDMTLDLSCGERPTIVIVSACYSGVFVPVLAAPNRMVMTAARPDRSSFGCGEDSRYPYFDGCMLKALPAAPTFPALAAGIRACVAAREKAERLTPASEPQIFVGEMIRPLLAKLSLRP